MPMIVLTSIDLPAPDSPNDAQRGAPAIAKVDILQDCGSGPRAKQLHKKGPRSTELVQRRLRHVTAPSGGC